MLRHRMMITKKKRLTRFWTLSKDKLVQLAAEPWSCPQGNTSPLLVVEKPRAQAFLKESVKITMKTSVI